MKTKLSLTVHVGLVTLVSILLTTIPVGLLAFHRYHFRLIETQGQEQIVVAQTLAAVLGEPNSGFLEGLEQGFPPARYDSLQALFDMIAYTTGTDVILAGRVETDGHFHVFMEGLRPLQPRHGVLGDRISLEVVAAIAPLVQAGGQPMITDVKVSNLTGLEVVIAYVPIFDEHNQIIGVVGTSQTVEEAFSKSFTFGLSIMWVMLLMLLLLMWIPIVYVQQWIKTPLNRLNRIIQGIVTGDIEACTRISSRVTSSEIQELFGSLTELNQELRGLINAATQVNMEINEGTLFNTHLKHVGKGEFVKVTDSLMDIKDTLIQYLQDLSCILVILSREGRVMFMNKNTGNYGYQVEDVLDRSIFEVFSTDVANKFYDAMDKSRNSRERVSFKVTATKAFGELYTANYDVIPILDMSYKITSFLIFGYDISELVSSQKEIKKAYNEMGMQLSKLTLSHELAKVATYELNFNVGEGLTLSSQVHWSRELESYLGYTDKVTYGAFNQLIHPDDRIDALDKFNKAVNDLTGQTPYANEYRVRHKDGHYLYVRDHIKILRDPQGHAQVIHGAMLDITEHRKLLASEIEQRKIAQQANETKSHFLSTVSHEIRTPMNAILGNVEIQLLNEHLSSEATEAFQNIHTAGHTLLSLINDVLDMSKVESNKLEIMNLKYELPNLISDTCYLNMTAIGSKRIDFVVDVDSTLPMHLFGDEIRIKQIISNLLSNAFKYTEQGSVNLQVSHETVLGCDQETVLVVSVSDTGQGMRPEEVQTIFESYSRFNTQKNYATEGVGLGMGIVKGLLSLMEGSIDIQSTPGVGSTFTVRIPQRKYANDVIGEDMADDLRHFKRLNTSTIKSKQLLREPMPYGSVLIVDDVETNLYVASGLLAAYHLQIETVTSGKACLEKIEAGRSYDVIFMDHMMPEMDGFETLEALRAMGYEGPVVALTANAIVSQAQTFLDFGFDDYISKPVDTRHLSLVLNRLIRDRHPTEVVERARTEQRELAPDYDTTISSPQILRVFLRDVQAAAIAIRDTMEASLPEAEMCTELRSQTHRIKGMLGNMGSKKLATHAATLEYLAQEGKAEEISKQLPWFLTELGALTDALGLRLESEGVLIDIESMAKPLVMLQQETTEPQPATSNRASLADKHQLLSQIQISCQDYDTDAIEACLEMLKQGSPDSTILELIDKLHDHLLHSEFEEIATIVGSYL